MHELHNYVTLSFSLGIPVVMIEYKATWIFNNTPPNECDNISTLLSQSKDMVEQMLILCNTSAVDVDITFRYKTLAFMVKYFQFQKLSNNNNIILPFFQDIYSYNIHK